MAKSLFAIGTLFGDARYSDMAVGMLNQVKEEMPGYGSGFSNWGMFALNLAAPFHEIVIAGPQAEACRKELARHYLPNKILAGTSAPSALSILEDRFSPDRTAIHVCRHRVCALPVESVAEALAQIHNQSSRT